ncbi:hypothetical protein D3C87_1519430 [compost metagenome]
MAWAASSLPVPLSPISKVVTLVGATRPIWRYSSSMGSDLPYSLPKRPGSSKGVPGASPPAFVMMRVRISFRRSMQLGLTR